MKNIKAQISILILLFMASIVQAAPTWTVDASQFSNSMTITGIVKISDTELSNTDDIVAAFVGNECRGVAHLLPSSILGHAYAYLVVNSNTNTETIEFKIFKNSTGTTINVPDTYTFVSDGSIGTQDKPYIFSDKAINGTAIQSLSLGITGETVNIDATKQTITVTLPQATDLTAVSPIITSSLGSQVTVNDSEINATIDLTNPLVITVTAQNGTKTNWTISVVIKTGIEENTVSNKVLVLPNGELSFIDFEMNAIYSLFSMSGQCLVEQQKVNEKSTLQTLPKASYVVVVSNSSNQHLFSTLLVW